MFRDIFAVIGLLYVAKELYSRGVFGWVVAKVREKVGK